MLKCVTSGLLHNGTGTRGGALCPRRPDSSHSPLSTGIITVYSWNYNSQHMPYKLFFPQN